MMRRMVAALLLLTTGACSSAPAPVESDVGPIESGWNLRAYSGSFAGYRPMDEAVDAVETAAARAEERVERRLGLRLDPERARVLEFADDVSVVRLRTRVIDGRNVKVVTLPAATIAQGRRGVEELVALAIARTALADYGTEGLPGWYVNGAPLWVSGGMERAFYERMLAGPAVVLSPDILVPPVAIDGGRSDPLASAWFFRFVAEEFGADRIPGLSRALTGVRDVSIALGAALGSDPASLPVAFDGYRLRTVGDRVEDPHVRELAAVRRLPPSERVIRLSGLAPRAASRFVAAAILEDLGLAQFEAGDPTAAAETLALVERSYALEAVHPARDLYTFALCFDRRGEPEAAALRLTSFLAEYSDSFLAPAALFRLAAIQLAAGRPMEARLRYGEIIEGFPDAPEFVQACLKLSDDAAARHLYARAADYLRRTGPADSARGRLARIEETVRGGRLPAGAAEVARDAFAEMSVPDGESGAETLVAMGPIAAPAVAEALAAVPVTARAIALRERLLRVYAAWGSADLIFEFLDDEEDTGLADAAIAALVDIGVPARQIRAMTETRSTTSKAARDAYRRRFGREDALPAVRGLLSSLDHLKRMEAAEILGGVYRPEAFPALLDLSRDLSPQVRRAAAASIGIREEDGVEAALVALLGDESPLVRVEALRALARRGRLDPVRATATGDEDPRVRLDAARLLYGADPAVPEAEQRDMLLIVRMLRDPDAMVRRGVESMLRAGDLGRAIAPALAEELGGSEEKGYAMRIVRVIAHLAPTDFGYDPAGDDDERERVATAFLTWWRGER